MPRFKAHIRDGRRKLADLEVDVRTPSRSVTTAVPRLARRAAAGLARAARRALS